MSSLVVSAALTALVASSALTRLPAAGGGEVVLSGENVQGKYVVRERRTELTGSPVKLVRGDATLTCKRLIAKQNEADEFQWATCEGDVRFVRGDRSITCEKATYDDPGATLTCEGNPELRTGKTILSGKRLVYDLTRDEASLDELTGKTPATDADTQLKTLGSRAKDAMGKKP